MNKSIVRFIIGVAFIGLGVYRLTSTTTEYPMWLSYIAIGYGVFSIGMGIYFQRKKTEE